MALTNIVVSVGIHRQRIFDWTAGIASQAHRPAHGSHGTLVCHDVNDRMGSVWINLRRVGVFQAKYIPSPIYNHDLHA